MSEPTKGLPDEEFLKQWASDYAKSEHNKGYIDSMAAEILRLRAELARAKRALERAGFVDNGGEEWKPPLGPTKPWLAGAVALATSYSEEDPPADVLGESLRGRLCAALLDERVPASIYGAVHELAQVVERIARAQRGGK